VLAGIDEVIETLFAAVHESAIFPEFSSSKAVSVAEPAAHSNEPIRAAC